MNWYKTKNSIPKRQEKSSYSQVPCLCYKDNQIIILLFNHEHMCWDGEDGDDYFCDIEAVEFYLPLSELPLPR